MSVSSPRDRPQLDQSTARALAQREVGNTRELLHQLQGRASADSFVRGTTTVTWPGGSPISNQATVNHGLRVKGQRAAPSSVQLTPQAFANANAHLQVDAAPDATSFKVRARTLDGSSPAAGTSCTFMWEARA